MRAERSQRKLLFVALAGATLLALFLFSIASLVAVQAATQATYQYGDADNDNDVDAADLSLIKNIVLDKSPWNPYADASRDGDVDAADFSLVRNIILGMNVAEQGYGADYNFNTSGAGTDDLAAWKNVVSRPTDIYANESGWPDFTSGDYDDVEAQDAAAFTVSGQSGNMSAVECRFMVDETGSLRSSITALGVEVVGNSSANATMQFWAWNFNSASWGQLGADMAIGTIEATYEGWSEDWKKVFAQYIDGDGYVYVLVLVTTAERDLTIDYIVLSLVTDTVAQTPTTTPTVSVTATPTESPTPTVSPTATATAQPTATTAIYFNQSSYTVSNGSYFQVEVSITNALLLTSGQFDVCFDPDVIRPNLSGSRAPYVTAINDTYDRSRFYEGGENGCGNISDIVGVGGNVTQGWMRILVDLGTWVQDSSGGELCWKGDFCGVEGSGRLTVITFRALKAGTCNIAFCGTLQMNQLWAPDAEPVPPDAYEYSDYTYPCSPYPDWPTPTPCNTDPVLIWGANSSVTVNP